MCTLSMTDCGRQSYDVLYTLAIFKSISMYEYKNFNSYIVT